MIVILNIKLFRVEKWWNSNMNEERLKQIGKFLETRMFIHRQVEHNSPWTTEEKMIVELYDSYITLLMEYSVYYKKQKEVIDKVVECLNLWQIPECDKGTMREILFNTNKQNVLDILNEVLE